MKPRSPLYMSILAVLVILFILFKMFVLDNSFVSSPYFWLTVIIAIVLSVINYSVGDLIENEKFKKLTAAEKDLYLQESKTSYFQRLYKGAFQKQTQKEEEALILDHGFDGIVELDNQLPKWWLNLFYFGMVYCVVYITSYFTTDFAHTEPEYNRELIQQNAEVAKYLETVPQANLETAKYSADNLTEGEQIFKTTCVSCHGDGGKGGIGPNLTDQYWINQKQPDLFKNVFWMLENGSPNNPTMVAFVKNGLISGNDGEKVAAYVYSLSKIKAPITTAQGGAAPQGTIAPWAN